MNLPADMAERWGSLRYLRYKGNGEWASECPVCQDSNHSPGNGQPDRFHIHLPDAKGNARGICRRCGHFEWLDEDKKKERDPFEILQQQELQRRYAEREQRRMQAKIAELQRQAYHRGYHDAMEQQHRKLWEDEGITVDLQDWFSLGYTPDKPYYYAEELHHSPALTIPYFATEQQVVNIQYRLTEAVSGAGKYRFTHELTPPLYLTEPDKPLTGDTCLLVEGAKKAIILYAWLGERYDHVVAAPSKYLSDWMYDSLNEFETVFILFDPDSFTDQKKGDDENKATVWRTAKRLGSKARVVQLPVKPDDFIVKYHQPANTLHRIIQQARRLT